MRQPDPGSTATLPSRWQTCIPEVLKMVHESGGELRWPRDVACPILRVCSSWRRTALATPHIWNRIDWRIRPRKLTEMQLESLQWWLSKTQGTTASLAVSLKVISRCYGSSRVVVNVGLLDRFMSTLLDRASSWRVLQISDSTHLLLNEYFKPHAISLAVNLKTLRFIHCYGDWRNQIIIPCRGFITLPNLVNYECDIDSSIYPPRLCAPNLVKFDLQGCPRITPEEFAILAKNVPSLCQLSLHNSFPPNPQASSDCIYPFPSLKSLFLDNCRGIPTIFLQKICRGAPLLERLEMVGSNFDLTDESATSRFPNLLYFVSAFDDDDELNNWSYLVQSSPLKTLDVVFSCLTKLPPTLPSSLMELTIRINPFFEDERRDSESKYYAALFTSIPNLERLTIEAERELERFGTSFGCFLDALLPFAGGSYICPKLQSLELRSVCLDDTIDLIMDISWNHTYANQATPKHIDRDHVNKDPFCVTLRKCFHFGIPCDINIDKATDEELWKAWLEALENLDIMSTDSD